MKFLKKVFAAVGVVVVLLVVIGLAAGGSKKSDSSSSSSSSQEQTQEQTSETKEAETKEEATNKDAEFTVTIDGAEVGTDYGGDPCIFVTWTFTNVSAEEPSSFALEFSPTVYQNGVQCDTAIADTDGGGNYMTKIKAGSSVQVTTAYALQDTTSDVEVEVKELFSWDNEIVASQTFQIA